MSLKDIYTAANDTDFQNRCKVAMWIAAQNIVSEDPATANHALRTDWGNRVLQNHIMITGLQLAMQVLRNPVISGNPTMADDGAIQFQVNSVIDAIMAIG